LQSEVIAKVDDALINTRIMTVSFGLSLDLDIFGTVLLHQSILAEIRVRYLFGNHEHYL